MTAYVSAGGYGPHGMMHQQHYIAPQIYRQQAQIYAQPQGYAQYAYAKPQVVYGQAGGSGGLLGQSGAAAGSIIPIVIIFVILAIFAPILIGSLVSSNDVVYSRSI